MVSLSNHARSAVQRMDFVRFGKTGLKVSRLCLGTMTYGSSTWRPWVLDEAESRPFIQHALEHGINFFDTADMYSLGESERVVGRALKAFATRDQVVLATKVFYAMGDVSWRSATNRIPFWDTVSGVFSRIHQGPLRSHPPRVCRGPKIAVEGSM